ncbi:MAG TPA: tyrosine-type recombinase/integrase [Bacillales bacterium]|nr:tyrosine-type recombinase/integrase [Bacillales bacterium]
MDVVNKRSLPQAAQSFFSELEKTGRRPSTIRRYAYDLENYFMWVRAAFAEKTWLHCTTEDVASYLAYLTETKRYSKRTVARVTSVLKRFYEHFLTLGMVAENPVEPMDVSNSNEDTFTAADFISDQEAAQLLESIPSLSGLSDQQIESRSFLASRNLAIVSIVLSCGMTLAELTAINMKDVHFEKKTVDIAPTGHSARTLHLKPEDMKLVFAYYKKIPPAVRPRRRSRDPLFVAFDYQRNTYRWDYSEDAPKRLTEIAVQKMIRQEVKRAGLRAGISLQHLRRTCILRRLQAGENAKDVQALTGMKTIVSLKKYIAAAANDELPRFRGS